MKTAITQNIKLAIVTLAGLVKDALHIYAGLAILLTVGCTGAERASLPQRGDGTPGEVVRTTPIPPSVAMSAGKNAKTDAPTTLHPAELSTSANASPPGRKAGAAANPAKPATSTTLDLASLEKRLRETEAIGAVGPAILWPFKCSMGSTAPS